MIKSIISSDQIKHIATLAKLDLEPNEVDKLKTQLAEILEYFKILNKVDTNNVEPTSQVTGLSNVYRTDTDAPSLTTKDVLSASKQAQDGMFKTNIIVTKI